MIIMPLHPYIDLDIFKVNKYQNFHQKNFL